MPKKIAILILTGLILSLCFGSVRAYSGEIDRVAVVTTVFDGDTFVIDNNESIRFADVDTPEIGESGYQQAKDFVINLVHGKTVYLDIDNLTTTDQYGRFVSVVYFDYNSTHYKNLNKALLDSKLAVEDDYPNNEFNPANWNLFESKTITTPNPSTNVPPTTNMSPTPTESFPNMGPTSPPSINSDLTVTLTWIVGILMISVISLLLYVRHLKKYPLRIKRPKTSSFNSETSQKHFIDQLLG
jgi:endonuclease YncB( thermonuclease family)